MKKNAGRYTHQVKHENRYVRIGLTAFLTVCAILLFYDTLFGSRAAVLFFRTLFSALAPIFYGMLIAYLLAPVVSFFERKLFPAAVERAGRDGRFCAPGPRAVSLVITWSLIAVLFYLLLSVLLPELYRSLVQLFNNLETYYNTINNWLTGLLEKNPEIETWVTQQFQGYYNDLLTLITEKVLPQAQQIMTAVSGGIYTALIFAKDLIVGIIVSVYLLATKELCAAQARKCTCALFSREQTGWIFRGIHKADLIFSGFVRGKLLDSLIIGILCFIFSGIFNFPYAPLVSVIVGVTNIIPFFGPFLGAIPSLFLILLVDPLKALYFLLFIFVLQQFDGNILGPKILGDKTGLSSLWVIIAILVGGTFFGIAGMFFGVPVLACCYAAATFFLEARLARKDLPLETDAYRTQGTAPANTPPRSPKEGK
jgi:predicted PurR-regulated permease PerM